MTTAEEQAAVVAPDVIGDAVSSLRLALEGAEREERETFERYDVARREAQALRRAIRALDVPVGVDDRSGGSVGDAILGLLAERGEVSQTEAAEALGLKLTQVKYAMRRMSEGGRVRKTGEIRSRSPVFALP